MSVKIRLTKRAKIIILASLVLLLAGAGGYLLWRVNNSETISPDVSEATGGIGACCGPAGCVAGWKCDTSQSCSETKTVTCSYAGQPVSCGTYKGVAGSPSSPCLYPGQSISCSYSIGGKCVKETSPNPEQPTNNGVCDIRKCEWPETLMSSNNCACETCKGINVNGCSGNPPQCTPDACPSGQVSCGVSGDSVSGCTKSTSCVAYHPDCNNPTVVYRYCKPAPTVITTNVCDSGTWVTKPTGTYAYCDAISYSATATDSDGIDQTSISVKLNNVSRTGVTKSNVSTTTTISETLSSTTNCLTPGAYTLAMDWKDTKGAASTNCALSTTFTVSEEVLNPDWSITKGVVEKCIDENTTDPSSQLTYTVTVKNTGEGEGTITKIVDSLDAKVLEAYISNISNSGIYADGDITWTLSDTDKVFVADQSKVFTYVITVPKDTFGTYANTVTAYPAEGGNVIADANVVADCVVEAPDTGIFDSTWAKILVGVLFIGVGVNYLQISKFTKKLYISVNEFSDERRKKNFEKKVVKR